jgi:hypothetical protein
MDNSRGKVPQLPKKPQDDIISTKRSQYQDQQLETKIGAGRIKQPSFGMRRCAIAVLFPQLIMLRALASNSGLWVEKEGCSGESTR